MGLEADNLLGVSCMTFFKKTLGRPLVGYSWKTLWETLIEETVALI